ncbi:MAG TPA: glucosidase, partial [Dermatophilaceae bacterium]|nr:glucosidase [Dermatophilaceae bacterium]
MAKTSSKHARTAEHVRLAESPDDSDPWRQWGPYVSARQWGTVREDYSADGDAWESFPFDQAHQRTYRWGEDGLAGLCDRWGFLNLGIALWNGQDDRLKERLFGLTNHQGNHGEDVKEYWWHLDATPTHSYAEWLYRYPQRAFPYADLVATNAARTRDEDEYELSDTGVLDDNRFFDVTVTHAKAAPEDICIRIEATNHGPDPAPLDLVPQLWFRNTWRWGRDGRIPTIRVMGADDLDDADLVAVEARHGYLGIYRLFAEGRPEVMVCDNETNAIALWGAEANATAYPKDGIDRAIVHGVRTGLNPEQTGTKVGLRYHVDAVASGATVTVNLRLRSGAVPD